MGKYIEVGLLMDNLKDGKVKDYEAVKEAVDNTPIAFDTDRVRAVEFMEGGRVKKVYGLMPGYVILGWMR